MSRGAKKKNQDGQRGSAEMVKEKKALIARAKNRQV